MKFYTPRALGVATILAFWALFPSLLQGEAMIQYFNTSWNEIARRMPELAEAGYDSIWVPPPTKAGGGLSVGYDLFDPFDLGSKDQRGSVSTLYGTQADLVNMITVAHRFGIRIYLDNVMNHRGFDVPGYNAGTPIDVYPGMLPEDFHLQLTQDGFYRNWPGISDYSDQWQVWNLSTSNLVDVAQEPGTTNANFGLTEGSTFQKISFVRHPNNPEYYCFDASGNYVGFGGLLNLAPNPLPAGFATAHDWAVNYIATHTSAYSEYVQDYLNRAARWLIDTTKADGLRLDAVKHIRYDFFGASFGADKDYSDYGYLGQVSRQFNLTRGFNDPKFNKAGDSTTQSDLRETVFDTESPRHNPMFFGEHLGGTPQQPYIDAGMRLVDNNLQSALINELPTGPLNGLEQAGGGGIPGGPGISVGYAQSADNGYMPKIQLAHAFLMARAGLNLIYSDGNHHAGVLGQISKAFPANANTNFLGQYGDGRIPNDLYIHNHFARGAQIGKWSDNSVVAFERQDKRENSGMSDADGTTLLFMMNGDSSSGHARGITTTFAAGSYLWQYAKGAADNGDSMNGFYYTVPSNQIVGDIVIPKGGYFAFSWRNPEQPGLNTNKPAIEILQNGVATPTLTYLRKDGPDGDPNFNPYNVTGTTAGSYSYPFTVPRVTNAQSLTFRARADGSAENILMELDGGVDINSQIPLGPVSGEKRDNPPGLKTDVFLGYEQMHFVQRTAEKFAARNTSRNIIGSIGAETYQATIGTSGFTVNLGGGLNSNLNTATYAYHDPAVTALDGQSGAPLQFNPPPQSAAGSTIDVWLKTAYQNQVNKAYLYYTTDGATFPEGNGGVAGNATTQVVTLAFQQHGNPDGTQVTDWWKGTMPALPSGTVLRYKVGTFLTTTASVFPTDANAVALKLKMETVFDIQNFNGTTATVYPHDDYGATQTGLSEGFHILRARAFLNRSGRSSIYNTFTQVFYYDAQPPQGEVTFPAHDNDSVGGQQYGVVVRTDPSVTEVWYKIVDSDPNNDDAVTAVANGNGAWVKATQLTANPSVASQYPNEWRFNYVNIPASGTGQIYVRLRELSSADSTQFSATPSLADDQAKHYTTLTRSVNTSGPLIKMFVAFPQTDGQQVDNTYVMKVWFSKSLGNNVSTADLIKRFLITISSSESGSPANPVVQGQAGYSITYNVDGQNGQYDELAYQLPNLYNGQPDFLHTITVTYTQAGTATLTATRLVKAKPVVVVQDNILSPPQFDSDGNTYQIILPDVASPTAAQRTVPITVQTDAAAASVTIAFTQGTVAGSDITLVGSSVNGSNKTWNFNWTNVQQGDYQFAASVDVNGDAVADATAVRDVHVVFRQVVTTAKGDSDDDGLSDVIENAPVPLPTSSSDGWTNDQVHLWAIAGKTDPTSPDTDNDGLSDGLELGWGSAIGDTSTTTDTNGDGVPNFQKDLDPPIYNVTGNATRPTGYEYFDPWPYNYNNSRTDLIAGTVTDPNKPDTDNDGLNDGIEDLTFLSKGVNDANGHPTYQKIHNGRVDILPNGTDGEVVIAHPPTNYNTSQIDRSKVLAKSPNAVWLETDPNGGDSDGDGASDGQEDVNQNGIVDLAVIDRNVIINGNFKVLATFSGPSQWYTVQGSAGGAQPVTLYYSDFCYGYTEPTDNKAYVSTCLSKARLNAIFRPNGQLRADGLDIVWLETDPRRYSTTGDGLPDGWKIQHGLDPFDDGVIGDYNLHTGKLITNTNNGPNGDPDGDGVNNFQEFLNGTDPNVANSGTPPPAGAITIGPGTATTMGAVTNNHEFTDWTATDLVALDPYDGDGTNYNQSDVYHAYDGWDSSRDLVAFYAHDGGDPATVNPNTGQPGDGNFYFRVDLHDLKAYAEQGNLDIYVAINFGNPGTGEFNLPDQIDTGTAMKWQAVVASYQTNVGTVYLWNPSSGTHSTAIGQDLSLFGVTARTQASANGFKKSYYNSDLDSVEFSISRQALRDAGWDGLDPTRLIYQVYTTKDGTSNSPVGAGDIGGRSDIRDSIRNDWIASDYYLDQQSIVGANSVLRSWVGVAKDNLGNYLYDNDQGKRVKVVSIVHGNQAIQPGSFVQNYINNTAGAGYYRPLDAHQVFNVPLTMHITPTLASAIQWAAADPNSAHPYRDGPALNARIATLKQQGLVDLLGTTFADHMLGYFPDAYNTDNIALANSFLTNIYGSAPSANALWLAERVADSNVLQKVTNAGFQYAFVDQMRHIFKWFGRSSALGDDGYRINQINNTKAFVVNDSASAYLLQNNDNGLPILMRQLLNRKARSGTQDQAVVFVNQWEDFANLANANAYDKNIRWLASRPWVQIVTPDQIAAPGSPNGTGIQWGTVNRGTGLTLTNVAKDFVDHADEEGYDHWYFGSGLEESLSSKTFSIRTGVTMSTAYGMIGTNGTIANSAWNSVNGLGVTPGNGGLTQLARTVLHASEFETAFHDQSNVDLSKFSTGAYINPDTVFQNLAGFSKAAQSQTREAAIYGRVNTWAQAATGGSYSSSVVTEQTDVDLDGEPEYSIFNDRLFALFEGIGGRMTGAWLRDVDTGYVTQVAGNFSSYSGSETEEEGNTNFTGTAINAYRTSGFKDWYAKPTNAASPVPNYVNKVYSVSAASSGWTFSATDAASGTSISKTITLGIGKSSLQASYTGSGLSQFYVRFGLSPDLLDLLNFGQKNLGSLIQTNGEVDLFNTNAARTVRAYLKFGTGSAYSAAANDTDANALDTVSMRNQAQTQQVEVVANGISNGNLMMNLTLGFETGKSITYDSDGDGIPDWWTQQYFGHPNSQAGDLSLAGDDPDHDGLTNLQEYLLGTNPKAPDAAKGQLAIVRTSPSGVALSYPTIRDRVYQILYSTSLSSPNWQTLGSQVSGDAAVHGVTDNASGPRFYKLQVSLPAP